MEITVNGRAENIRVLWDMSQSEYMHLFDPVTHELTDYAGAVFFGNYKLEFIKNSDGGYCNLFQYGAEDVKDRAYAYLEDGTPYEDRDALCDEIRCNKCPSFETFAEDIEGQIRSALLRHPECIPDALAPTEPDKWYPCDHPYQIDEYTREA